MDAPSTSAAKSSFTCQYPAASYFALTFTVSWTAAFLLTAPRLLQDEPPLPKLTALLMFPAMLVGPSFSGIFLTRWLDGRQGLQSLFERMRRFQFPLRWYIALLIPPAMVLAVLLSLKTFVSLVYAPNRFWIGVTFGVLAGFLVIKSGAHMFTTRTMGGTTCTPSLLCRRSNDFRLASQSCVQRDTLRGKLGRKMGAKLSVWRRNWMGAGEEDNRFGET